MKKILFVLATVGLLFAFGSANARAAGGVYDPDTGIVKITNPGGLGASYEDTSSVPVVNDDTLSFEYRSADVNCGGGVPRVFIQGGAYNTFDGDAGQCGTDTDGDGWYTVTGTISGIVDGTVGHFGLVNDDPSDAGTVEFRNVTVNGASLLPPMAPQNKDECKNGGWRNGSYRNQGECVSVFARSK